ncbi:unnamed protein product [Urochloa humidicola]
MAAAADADAAGTGDPLFFAAAGGGGDSACSTPFVSAPSSPSRDRDPYHLAACFYSAPASPTRGGGKDFAGGGLLDFDFDFSSRFPSPSAAAMSSADELFCNGQIRPVRLAAALLQPQQPLGAGDAEPLDPDAPPGAATAEGGGADERGRVRGRSVRRKARSMSPFRTHWRRSPAPPAPHTPETESAADEPAAAAVTPAASRSSSSSSTASSASSSSSSRGGGSRRWGGFLKDLLHRSKSDGGGKTHHLPSSPAPPTSPSPPPAPKRSTSPSPATRSLGSAAGHRRRRSAHERLYAARRAEAEEMRRRTYLPYRQGFLLFGCIGLGNRGVHGLARGLNAAAAVSSRS